MSAVQPSTSRFRPDVEGLRALAIGLVLVFHAGVPFLPGGFIGVDVFFVISGFLITGLLIREIEANGKISLARFWGRRAKRLLPASVVMLVVTAVGTYLVMPNTTWRSIGSDIAATAVYLVNWRFAAEAVDYNAEGAGVSPVLHFWSLAVEEQYYIVWPLLLAAVAVFIIRKLPARHTRPVIGGALALIVVPSFVWSIVYTGQNPDAAYFVTTTRLWELGVGAFVAVGANQWHRIPGWLAVPVGWAGFLAVVAGGFLLTEQMAWPGYLALVPVLGTAAVLLATTGREPGGASVSGLLSWKPFVWIGGLSYSWYLWHWPLLVLARAQFGELRLRYAILVTLCAGVLAWLSLHLVENPIRRAPAFSKNNWLALSGGLNLSLLGVLTGVALILAVPASSTTASVDTSTLGAHSLSSDAEKNVGLADINTAEFIVPAPADATSDMPPKDEECKVRADSGVPIACEWGDPEGDVTVVAVGDSKIQHLESALAAAAEQHGWRLITYFKSGCAFADPQFSLGSQERQTCAEWNTATLEQIVQLHPDVVITSGRNVRDGETESGDIAPGAEMIASWWNALQDADITVIPVLDNPAPPFEVYECVAEHADQLSECSFDREEGVAESGAKFQLAAMELTGITDYVDFSDIVCPVAQRCPAVIGNVLVYRQGSHITNTYVKTMTDVIGARLDPLISAAKRG